MSSAVLTGLAFIAPFGPLVAVITGSYFTHIFKQAWPKLVGFALWLAGLCTRVVVHSWLSDAHPTLFSNSNSFFLWIAEIVWGALMLLGLFAMVTPILLGKVLWAFFGEEEEEGATDRQSAK